jgi:uncharacterized protein YbjT (DUF2867 family)
MNLLTGATGYIGRLLLPRLQQAGQPLRCLVRRPEALAGVVAPTTEVVQGDVRDPVALWAALDGVHTAYYLVHSMAGRGDFETLDREAAMRFGEAARLAGVRRIIYVGGLGDERDDLSPHLRSRHETGACLSASGVPVVELRASIVIGQGSLSFEMVRALVERLPVMVCPRWVAVKTQPIAARDLVEYLMAALELPPGAEGIYEIGGPDVVSYGDIMREYARQRGLRRLLIPVPLLTPRLSSLWLTLVTPLHARVGRKLIDGVRNSTTVRSDQAARTFGIRPLGLREAIAGALETPRRFVDVRRRTVAATPARAFAPVRRIGGRTGWYAGQVLWRIRGLADRLLGGPGLSRGRRDPETCEKGDVIDCWRVEEVEPDRRLRLVAEMKLPGRAWLEFEVLAQGPAVCEVRQTATFEPRGLAGRLYWYALYPVHAVMFARMLAAIAARASAELDRTVPPAEIV